MDRLTEIFHGEYIADIYEEETNESNYLRLSEERVNKIVQRLGEIEDLMEKGLLLRLPCEIGTSVWQIIKNSGGGRIPDWYELYETDFCPDMMVDGRFGNTVFLTQVEAEQRIKELENNK